MADDSVKDHRSLPPELSTKIHAFRDLVRRRKIVEILTGAALALTSSYLLVFILDRVHDLPGIVRAPLTVAGFATVLIGVPFVFMRWVVGTRKIDQVARVLSRRDPDTGDRVLSAIELTEDGREFVRSPVLAAAAIRQVNEDLRTKDFAPAAPEVRTRSLSRALLLPACAIIAAFIAAPRAATSSFMRWVAPFGDTPRYTFAEPEAIPSPLYVARGEPFRMSVRLDEKSAWRPKSANAAVERGEKIAADALSGAYTFEFAGVTRDSDVTISIGDFEKTVKVVALDRPEITSLELSVKLPSYLGIAKTSVIDGRSGSVGVVNGAEVRAQAKLSRDLKDARESDRAMTTDRASFASAPVVVTKNEDIRFTWTDVYGLEAKAPFVLGLRPHDDLAPSVHFDDLKNGAVILDSDTATFKVVAADDFGVRRTGIEWRGVKNDLDNPNPAKGERLVFEPADPDQGAVSSECAFCAKTLGIPAQEIDLLPWAEDALPGRARTYGAPLRVYVLTPEQHMIWLTAQLNAWRDESIEVRDREVELWDTNKALRHLTAAELDRPANRKKLEAQSAAEKANGRRLNGLVGSGKDLLAQAARNPEFNATSLDDWAEQLKLLEGIAKDRMPSVADLLAKAARAATNSQSAAPTAGTDHGKSDPSKSGPSEASKLPNMPTVADVESTFMEKKPGEGSTKKSAPPPTALRMAQTMLASTCPPKPDDPNAPDNEPDSVSQAELDKALAEQKKLLEEFAALSGKIKEVLLNLEGSTFVKRFKSESREQTKVSKALRAAIGAAFGAVDDELAKTKAPAVEPEPALREKKSSESMALIQDDLSAYVTRLDGEPSQQKFKTVLDEMKKMSVTAKLKDVANAVVAKLEGDATVSAEYWADTADRWAEQLVGPG